MDGFDSLRIDTARTSVVARVGGSGPPLLLLDGFPQTHPMWREVAPRLARRLTVVCVDPPARDAGGSTARDMATVMVQLGFRRFSVAGHCAAGPIARRLALEHAGRVRRLAMLDGVPAELDGVRCPMLALWSAGEHPERTAELLERFFRD